MGPKKTKLTESKAHPNDGKRLALIRRKNRKTQIEFAAEFQVSIGTIGNYERGLTEMPPSFWRAVNKSYGLNPTPRDAEESPMELLKASKFPQLVEKDNTPRSMSSRLARLRIRTEFVRKEMHSAGRRFIEEALHAVFLTATLVFFAEQIFRAIPSISGYPSNYRDIVFVSAFLVMSVLLIPVLLSIPWGVKVNEDSEFHEA